MPALKQLSPIPCAVTVGYAVLAAVVASVPLSKRMESERIVLLWLSQEGVKINS